MGDLLRDAEEIPRAVCEKKRVLTEYMKESEEIFEISKGMSKKIFVAILGEFFFNLEKKLFWRSSEFIIVDSFRISEFQKSFKKKLL